jgi:hypothetical protein
MLASGIVALILAIIFAGLPESAMLVGINLSFGRAAMISIALAA